MTPRQFCESGQGEHVKGYAHGAAATICAAFMLYNGASFVLRPRREWHLVRNAIVYAFATGWEVAKTRRHFRK